MPEKLFLVYFFVWGTKMLSSPSNVLTFTHLHKKWFLIISLTFNITFCSVAGYTLSKLTQKFYMRQNHIWFVDNVTHKTPNSLKWSVLGSKGSLPPPHHQGQLWTVPPCDWIAFRQFISLKIFTSPFRFGAPWRLTLVAIVMFHRG